MNAMVQDMSWDLAARQEGSEVTALSSIEMNAVSGGSLWAEAAIAAGSLLEGGAVGWGIARLIHRRRNR